MIGFLYKDFLVLKKQIRFYALFLVVYGVMSISGMGIGFLTGLVSVVGLVLPMSSIAYDEQARWDKFAASTPAGRSGIVNGKYLFSLIVTGGTAVLVTLLSLTLHLAGLMKEGTEEILLTILACVGVSLAMSAVTLPLLLKFGAEKSRAVSMGFFVAIFGGILLCGYLSRAFTIPQWLISALPAALGVLAVGGFGVSYCVSRAIFEKKEL